MADDMTEIQGMDSIRRAQEQSLQGRPLPQIPGYEVEMRLGEGAYGEVWVARDRKNPGRRVAIKFYTRRGGDWTLLAREVEKLNFLATDRYVVQVLNVGWDSDPPYYVMEFMERGSLAERLEKGTLPVSEALPLFRDVVVGVVNAHGRGVLHCDIKPANVLLGPDGKPRLADFGQSRLSHEDRPALGTMFYMAPEQADPKATPDARWDVYALGALLYCLLTGEPPYRDAPGVDTLDEPTALEERLARYRRLLREAPRPRKHRRVPGVDRALAEIIDRCVAVNPARRFANAQAVLNALDARALRRARRPLLVMGALAPVLLLLVMGYLIRSERRRRREIDRGTH
jgi:serine/threonine protein kinase